MKEAGLIRSDNMRLPMVGVSADTRAKIKLAMKQYGIKK
jgi:dihydrodipicolinate synthase/N-acetylneuraminate lyase